MSQFRRSGERDERRRRILLDENHGVGETSAGAPRIRLAAEDDTDDVFTKVTYTEAARPERQPRITDFVPTRWRSVAAFLILGLGTIAALTAVHSQTQRWGGTIAAKDLAALDLAGRGSLAAWFSGLTLGMAGLASLLIYTLRRHKLDDYRGRYRIWFWAAALWLVASVDAATGLHDTVRGLLVCLLGTSLLGDGSVWWIGLYVLMAGTLGVAVAIDVYRVRTASAALTVAAGCYAVAAASRLGLLNGASDRATVMATSGVTMLAHWMLLMSLCLYARYVCLDAQGLVVHRKPRRGKKETTSWDDLTAKQPNESDADRPRRTTAKPRRRSDLGPVVSVAVDEEASKPAPAVAQRLKSSPAKRQPEREAPAEPSQMETEAARLGVDPDMYACLSKAERRHLRKQRRKQRRKAA